MGDLGATVNFNGAKYDCLLFDLDDTLYPLSAGINLACRKNIEEFMLKYLHIEKDEVPRMCLELYREYGTTMAGLKALGYKFDNDEYHEYVHGRLPYQNLKPDTMLRNLLLSTPQRKIIFTNSDKAHTARALKKLGLEDCFEVIICFETLNHPDDPMSKSRVLCKPLVDAYVAAIAIANLDPKRTIFFDDSTRNIASAKAAGLKTVVVGTSELVPGADYALSSIHNMKETLPEIWNAEAKEQQEQVFQSTVVAFAAVKAQSCYTNQATTTKRGVRGRVTRCLNQFLGTNPLSPGDVLHGRKAEGAKLHAPRCYLDENRIGKGTA